MGDYGYSPDGPHMPVTAGSAGRRGGAPLPHGLRRSPGEGGVHFIRQVDGFPRSRGMTGVEWTQSREPAGALCGRSGTIANILLRACNFYYEVAIQRLDGKEGARSRVSPSNEQGKKIRWDSRVEWYNSDEVA